MDFAGLPLSVLAITLAITFFAGFVKGTIGFAMPTLMISAFSGFLAPDVALAGLILPTLVTNISQAFRQGWRAAWDSARVFWRFLVATVVFLVIFAQFVQDIPRVAFLLILGVPITLYAGMQLAGWKLAIAPARRNTAEWGFGILAGIYGGLAGIWGPPLVLYLISVDTPKTEAIRVQGVVFLLGAAILLGAHLHSGVLSPPNLAFSGLLCLPALVGIFLGYRVGDRMDQARFRFWTQILLVLTGLNLIRLAIGL